MDDKTHRSLLSVQDVSDRVFSGIGGERHRMIVFTFNGPPVAKGRARATKAGHHYTPAKTRQWEAFARGIVITAMQGRERLAGPIRLEVRIAFAVPPSWPTWKRSAALAGEIRHTGKPDADNVVKAVKDALNPDRFGLGGAWRDDAQVVELEAIKLYATHPFVEAVVIALPGTASDVTRRTQP